MENHTLFYRRDLGISSGAPPSAWKAKGELEGVVVNLFLSLFSRSREKRD